MLFAALLLTVAYAQDWACPLKSAIQQAQSLNTECAITILTQHSSVFIAMDGVPAYAADLAIARAKTSLEFGTDTLVLGNLSAPFSRYFGVQSVEYGEYATGPGGLNLEHPEFQAVGVACSLDGTEENAFKSEQVAQSVKRYLQNEHKEVCSFDFLQDTKAIGSVISLKRALNLYENTVFASKKIKAASGFGIAIVDSGANLKFAAGSSSKVRSGIIRAAQSKSRSARLFNLDDSSGLNNASQPNAPAFGVQITNGGLFTVGGASVIYNSKEDKDATQIIGSIGIEYSPSAEVSENDISQIVSTALENHYATFKKTNSISLRMRRGITSLEANAAVQFAIKYRKTELLSSSTPGVYVVTDVAGHIKAFYAEDGVESGAPDIAQKSSKASALFQINSDSLGKLSQPGKPLYNVEYLYGGLVSFESASIIRSSDGKVIGAIGVSGTGAGKGTANDGLLARKSAEYVAHLSDDCALQSSRCPRVLDSVIPIALSSESKAKSVTLSNSLVIVNAIQKYNVENNQYACISVFGPSVSYPRAFMCQDDAFIGATDLSPRKSLSAHSFGKPNSALQPAQSPGGILWKIEVTNGGLFFNAGGEPLLSSNNSSLLGSIGVAGARDDHESAVPGVDIWNRL